jgi:hypothetical protein
LSLVLAGLQQEFKLVGVKAEHLDSRVASDVFADSCLARLAGRAAVWSAMTLFGSVVRTQGLPTESTSAIRVSGKVVEQSQDGGALGLAPSWTAMA